MEYAEIAKELRLDAAEDKAAAELLDGILKEAATAQLESFLRRKCAIVFGAGPSLKNDLGKLKAASLQESCVLIAAGGAIKALLETGIVPQIHVTDLDGDADATLKANRKGTITVVHAHGDNMGLIREQVPLLKDVLGTTQVPSFGRLLNFGGFSDGDRAAYLAAHYGAAIIALAGMDFGTAIGEYSGSRDPEFTRKKLAIGKRLLEELASETESRLVNITGKGAKLAGIPRISVEDLRAAAAHLQ